MFPPLVYLNGTFLPPEQAQVSCFDRGFVFADGVYEVIPAYGGRLFRLPQHLARLDNSLAGIRLSNPLAARDWQAVFTRLVEAGGGGDQSVDLQGTRGPAERDHPLPKPPTPPGQPRSPGGWDVRMPAGLLSRPSKCCGCWNSRPP